MNFKQCISRAFDRAGFAQGAQQAAYQRGLACPEIAFEPDYKARRKALALRQPRSESQRSGFVGQGKFRR